MASDYAEFAAAFPWFFPVAAFLLGACVGSFLNVVIYRMPKHESVVMPGSHCACGQPIRWYDNIPILSWLLLRGRARCCGQRFSFRYPFVELLTGALFAATWIKFPPAVAVCGWVFLSCLVAATFIDLDHFIIPDLFTTGLAVMGVLLSFAVPALHDQVGRPFLEASVRSGLHSLLGAAIGSGLVLWIALVAEAAFQKEAMGFGDVKFVGAIGAFCGWQGAIAAMFGGAIVGVVWVALAWAAQKLTGQKSPLTPPTEAGEELDLPFALSVWDIAAAGAGVLGVLASVLWPAFFGYESDLRLIDSVRSGAASLRGLLIGSGIVLWVVLLLPFLFRWDTAVFAAVRFAGALGAFSHWRGGTSGLVRGALLTLLAAGFSVVVWRGVVRMLARRNAPPPPSAGGEPSLEDAAPALGLGVRVPFGPMLAVAGALYFLIFRTWVDAWFEQVLTLL